MSDKITVPKHLREAIDPVGKYKKVFVPEVKGVRVEWPEESYCPKCGKKKFVWQKVCPDCL
jgi:hypothetical protein